MTKLLAGHEEVSLKLMQKVKKRTVTLTSSYHDNCLCQIISNPTMRNKIIGRTRTGLKRPPPSNFIAGRPKAALLIWFFGGFRYGVPLFIVIFVIY